MFRVGVVALLIASFLHGCSGDPEGPPTAPVSGVVKYQGQPVKNAKVVLFPQNVAGGMTAIGFTDDEGRFDHVINAASGDETAVVGQHFVTVTESWPPDAEIPVDDMGMQQPPPRGPWAQKFRDSASGALRVEVLADKDNAVELDLSK